jgi:pimeloyl-ACP methyl ester carboxylesterase
LLLVFAGKSYSWWVNWVDLENVEISSATLSVRDQGVGSPTVIIIIGMATENNDYHTLQKTISQHTRVLSYDRPGLGASPKNSEPKTFDVFAEDLDELLQIMEVPPPYILVGHSMGGLFIRYYADLHPESVAGLVFLDTSHEDWFQYIRETWTADEQRNYFAFWDDDFPEYVGARREEKSAFEENFNMVRGSKIDEDMPVLVYTGGRHHHFRPGAQDFEADQQKWIDLHKSLVVGVKNAKHTVDLELNHWLHYEMADDIASDIAEIVELENKSTQ